MLLDFDHVESDKKRKLMW